MLYFFIETITLLISMPPGADRYYGYDVYGFIKIEKYDFSLLSFLRDEDSLNYAYDTRSSSLNDHHIHYSIFIVAYTYSNCNPNDLTTIWLKTVMFLEFIVTWLLLDRRNDKNLNRAMVKL